MHLLIDPHGVARCVYGETIDLAALGPLTIRRASRVEPDEDGAWWADLSPVGGPRLGPFTLRSLALAAEEDWLDHHWLLSRFHPLPITPDPGGANEPAGRPALLGSGA
jgi:hypothetical protein